jgi:hypothetical protein
MTEDEKISPIADTLSLTWRVISWIVLIPLCAIFALSAAAFSVVAPKRQA